jgi:type 1 fimbriae regulatory protein FimE
MVLIAAMVASAVNALPAAAGPERRDVHRVKNGMSSVHPIRGDEMRALRKLRRDYPKDAYVFVSERGGPNACGFELANDGHDTRALQHYLGHKNIQHTVRYTEMAPDRFKDFWRN